VWKSIVAEAVHNANIIIPFVKVTIDSIFSIQVRRLRKQFK